VLQEKLVEVRADLACLWNIWDARCRTMLPVQERMDRLQRDICQAVDMLSRTPHSSGKGEYLPLLDAGKTFSLAHFQLFHPIHLKCLCIPSPLVQADGGGGGDGDDTLMGQRLWYSAEVPPTIYAIEAVAEAVLVTHNQ
jgi:hypothetical protein